jgi:hypothetical protein
MMVPVRVLLPARGDLLRPVRVGASVFGSALLTLSGCNKTKPIDEAKAAGQTMAALLPKRGFADGIPVTPDARQPTRPGTAGRFTQS